MAISKKCFIFAVEKLRKQVTNKLKNTIMKTTKYCIRKNFVGIKPNESGELISKFESYEMASEECTKLRQAGQKGVYVCEYEQPIVNSGKMLHPHQICF